MIYTLPYILLILFLAVLAWLYPMSTEESKGKMQFLCLFVFMIFFGCRGFIGDDWTSYYPFFMKYSVDNIENIGYIISESNFEPGFTLLMLICKWFINDFSFFVFICSAINCTLLFIFLRKRVDNFPLALLFFVCMGGFGMQTNLMRNSISILLFANALDFIKQRKMLPYFVVCSIALTFHASSILYFPLYFFFHKKCPKWLFLIIFVMGNLVFLLHIRFITPVLIFAAGKIGETYEILVRTYLESEFSDMNWVLSIGYLERLLTGFLVYCYYNKLVEIRKENVIFINSYIAYFFMYFFFSEFNVIGTRLSTLFIFFYWILWGDIIKCFSIKSNKMFFIIFLSIYCVMKIIGMTRLITLEYDNVLFGAKSYEERLYIHQKNAGND